MEVYKDFKRYSLFGRRSIITIGKGIGRGAFSISIKYDRNIYYGNDS